MPISTIKITATETIAIGSEEDVVYLIRYVRMQAQRVGMTVLNQTKLITATSELACNILNYAGAGDVLIDMVKRGKQTGLRLTFKDNGPGIADLTQAMQNGHSTGMGLGLGLPGAKRLSSEFFIKSTVGQGTTVVITKWTNG
ncbi:ATP-binding protein [Spirosoma flavum]|uniref:ATP-binding protein n=1 Tax=Spirosoma flavum TaxID=2048557 RepID=A0ABW6AGJ6_9BACT